MTSKNQYSFLIHEFEHNYLYLGEHQFFQGYCVLVSKKHFRELIDLPEKMRNAYFEEFMKAHEVISKVFRPKKMNLSSLGNVVDHMHWHFFPRYEKDPFFKDPPWLRMDQFESARINDSERDELIQKIRMHFN